MPLAPPCHLKQASEAEFRNQSTGQERTGFLEQAGVLARLIRGVRSSLVPVKEAREHYSEFGLSAWLVSTAL